MTLRDRLREWWRVHYMEEGFGVLTPGYERQREADEALWAYWRVQLGALYPGDTGETWSWYIIYRRVAYIAPDYAYAEGLRARICRLNRLPERFGPAIHCRPYTVERSKQLQGR